MRYRDVIQNAVHIIPEQTTSHGERCDMSDSPLYYITCGIMQKELIYF